MAPDFQFKTYKSALCLTHHPNNVTVSVKTDQLFTNAWRAESWLLAIFTMFTLHWKVATALHLCGWVIYPFVHLFFVFLIFRELQKHLKHLTHFFFLWFEGIQAQVSYFKTWMDQMCLLTSGEGRLWESSPPRGLVSSLSPRVDRRIWAMTVCCSTEQWFSRDRIRG